MRKRTIWKMSAIVAACGLVFAMFLTGCTLFDNDNGGEGTNNDRPIVGPSAHIERVMLENGAYAIFRFDLPAGARWADFENITAYFMVDAENMARPVRHWRLMGVYAEGDFELWGERRIAYLWTYFNAPYIMDNTGRTFANMGVSAGEWFSITYDISGASAHEQFSTDNIPSPGAIGPFFFGVGISGGAPGAGGITQYIGDVTLRHRTNPALNVVSRGSGFAEPTFASFGTPLSTREVVLGSDAHPPPNVPPGNTIAEQLEWIRNNAQNNSSFIIDVSIGENIAPQNLHFGGMTVGITLRGTGVMRTVGLSGNGSLFTVGSGVTLTLDNNITLRGVQDNNASLVRVNNGGILVMNGGSVITGNITNSSGGGVHVGMGGVFTMRGGEISHNAASGGTAWTGGGGVIVNGGMFEMERGAISNNIANNSGGVHVGLGGVFVMRDGEISNNTSNGAGGGVFTHSVFDMHGGRIFGNTSGSLGGGVNVYSDANGIGIFTMHSGEISGNTARSNTGSIQGGGVFVNGTFDMRGGEIANNTAVGHTWGQGGGVAIGCYVRGLFVMRGGKISGNTVVSNGQNWVNGGGVHVSGYNPAGGTFQMSGGVISDSNIGRHVENTVGSSSVLSVGTAGAHSATAQHGTFSPANVFTALGNLHSINTTLRVTNGELERPPVPLAFFDLATYSRFQNLRAGETEPWVIFDSQILQQGGWGEQVAFEIVRGQSGNALRVNAVLDWVGFDLMHSGFDFRAGDFIRVAGTALTDAQMLLNTYHAGWRSLGSYISVQAGNTFLFERTLTQADVNNILANTGTQPQSIRIRANATGTEFIVSEITVGRFATDDGGHLGQILNLSGQVWDSETAPVTGNRQVTSSVGGSGVITNGQLSFTVGTPSHLVSASDVFDDVLGDYFTNVSVSNAGARGAFIDNLDLAGRSGILWREFGDGVTGYLVAYIFADRNFTVTGNGRTFTETWGGFTTIISTQNFNIGLRAGWNVVYQRFAYGVSGGMETINISVGLGDPVRARWRLLEWTGFQTHSENIGPMERARFGRLRAHQ